MSGLTGRPRTVSHELDDREHRHRAEIALAGGYRGPLWWLNIFAGAACGGLLLSRWLPQGLDRSFGTPGQPALFLAAFFVFLNLHHYLIDASIWRSRGGVVKAMVRPATTAPSVREAAVPVA